MMCTTLQRTLKQHVDFDPSDSAHRNAFLSLMLNSRQDTNFRFYVDLPFTSVVTQTMAILALKMCEAELAKYGHSVETVLQLLKTNGPFPTLEEPVVHADVYHRAYQPPEFISLSLPVTRATVKPRPDRCGEYNYTGQIYVDK